jgi:hypothetical protein
MNNNGPKLAHSIAALAQPRVKSGLADPHTRCGAGAVTTHAVRTVVQAATACRQSRGNEVFSLSNHEACFKSLQDVQTLKIYIRLCLHTCK